MGASVRFTVFVTLLFGCEAGGSAVLEFEEAEPRAVSSAHEAPAAREPLRQSAPAVQRAQSAGAGLPCAGAGGMEVPAIVRPAADGGGATDIDAGTDAELPPNTPSAGAGGSPLEAGSGGASDPPAPRKQLNWACTQRDRSCECVLRAGDKLDACDIPKPTCCYALPDGEHMKCQCLPNGSPECEQVDTDPEARRITVCPY